MHRALAASIVALVLSSPASALYLYGITETHLVEIDLTDPSRVRTIGAHGLDARLLYALDNVPDGDRLIGMSLVDLGGGVLEFTAVEYDIATGVGSELAFLGDSNSIGTFDSLVYVDSVDSLVASFGADNATHELITVDPDTGATSPVVDSPALDIDASAYDDVRDLYYAWDPNGAAQLEAIDLTDGSLTPMGSVPSTFGDGAFSEGDGGLFILERADNSLVQVQTTDGFGPITLVAGGAVAGDPLRAIAFSPVPEPHATAALAIGAAIVISLAQRRRLRQT